MPAVGVLVAPGDQVIAFGDERPVDVQLRRTFWGVVTPGVLCQLAGGGGGDLNAVVDKLAIR